VFLLQSSNIRIVKVFCISLFSVLVFLLSFIFAGYLLVCKYPVFFLVCFFCFVFCPTGFLIGSRRRHLPSPLSLSG
jgi:uncharacterized RDD family membrane protein YckC